MQANHHKPPQTTANHHQNTRKKSLIVHFFGWKWPKNSDLYISIHAVCTIFIFICTAFFLHRKALAPPIEYTWCQFKMTSLKCPYLSKPQVIILTVHISPWNIAHHTKQARHPIHRHMNMLGAICGSAQSMDLPAQSMDPLSSRVGADIHGCLRNLWILRRMQIISLQ